MLTKKGGIVSIPVLTYMRMRMRTHILSDLRTHAHTHTHREELENAQKVRTQTF